MSVRVSVVVPTYKRPGLLARCLSALLAQDLERDAYEVIVVDDEPSPETRRTVALHAMLARVDGPVAEPVAEAVDAAGRPLPEREPAVLGGPRVRYLHTDEVHGPAAARNIGWRAAEGAIIAFTDDDCLPEPGWLRAGLEAMRDADGATGRIVVPRGERPTDFEAMTARLETVRFATANCFYRRDLLECLGGFDERFRTAWREDSDLHFAATEAGARLVEAPRAVVTHPVRRAPWGVSVSEQRKSQFNALLYRKHPELYRREVGSRPSLLYLATVTSLAIALGGAATRTAWPAVAGAAAWTALTALFAARRLRGTSRRPGHVAEMAVTSMVIPPLSLFWRLRGAVRFRVLFI